LEVSSCLGSKSEKIVCNNATVSLILGIEDGAGRMAVVVHPDPDAVLAAEWQK
jgi:hypothetical protein